MLVDAPLTTPLDTVPPLSPLGATLRYVQMTGIFYCPSIFTEPWGIELPPMEHCVWFHIVTSGRCTVDVAGTTLDLRAGDLILVPHGTGHRFWGTDPAPTPNVLDLPHDHVTDQYAVLRHGGGGATTEAVCGGVRLDHPASRHLIDALPPLIHIEAALSTRGDWMRSTLDLIADETRSPRPGSEAVVSRLCDIVVIQAIRSWILHHPSARTGWLGALQDEQIGPAIAHIHTDPGAEWTVAALADAAHMSRSAFSARFSELVGEPAMKYVTRWRMHVAADRLANGNDTVAIVAAELGYDSEAAFSRAFKRMIGTSPGEIRRTGGDPTRH